MTRDHRDLCIGHLAADLLATEDMLGEALVDSQSYRLLAQQAIHTLHERGREIHRQQQTIKRLRDEIRCMREIIGDLRVAA